MEEGEGQIEPGAQPVQTEQTAPVVEPPENWFERHPVWVGVIIIIVFIIAAILIVFFFPKTQEIKETISSGETPSDLELVNVIYYDNEGNERIADTNISSRSKTELDCYYDTGFEGHRAVYIGVIKNNGDSLAELVEIDVSFFDVEGKIVGSNFTYINDLEAGEERLFRGSAINSLKWATCDAKISLPSS